MGYKTSFPQNYSNGNSAYKALKLQYLAPPYFLFLLTTSFLNIDHKIFVAHMPNLNVNSLEKVF